jgi:glycosyltransferase involved in cell wall biosynthesis
MKIQAFILCNNEEMIMPYLMRHYSQFADVVILENNSSDNTVALAKSLGAEVWKYDVPDEINDQWYMDVKNNCWKGSTADWVIVGDADEFVYHPDIVRVLHETKATIFLPRLFNMFSEKFPTTPGQIYEEVNMGIEGGGKMNVFRPSAIQEMNYDAGCHSAHPVGDVQLDVVSPIITLHMRNLSKQYVIDRNARASARLSELNKTMGWGYHYNATPEEIGQYFDNEMTALVKVV